MSNARTEGNSGEDQNHSNDHNQPQSQQNYVTEKEPYTIRQMRHAFDPLANTTSQQAILTTEQQCIDNFHSLQLASQPEQQTAEITVGSNPSASVANTSTNHYETSNETKTTTNEVTDFSGDREIDATKPRNTTSLIYDLKKYKHDYFISTLSCEFDREHGKFGSPTGITTLNDDRLLVANYDRDSLLLLDTNGVVYQIYKDLPSPKDVLYYSSTPSQVIVAARKELIIVDLETSKIVRRSKAKGFYPWNVQYTQETNIFAACDPSGERIVYFDQDLAEIGNWSFNNQAQHALNQTQSQTYQKTYPYAAHFLSDNTSFVLTHYEKDCRLVEYDIRTTAIKAMYTIPPLLQSYFIYVDKARKCLIADKPNHRLVSIGPNSTIEEFKYQSMQQPYAMTFLSTGTLCVTSWNKSYGTVGGITVISETDLKKTS